MANIPKIAEELHKLPPELVQAGLKDLKDELNYWDKLSESSNGLTPASHQARGAYEVLERGDGSVLFEYATGSGKTFIPSLVKAGLEDKLGRQARVLVVSPEQAFRTAWSQEELDSHGKSLGTGRQKRVHLNGRKSSSDLEGYDFLGLNYHKFGYIDPKGGSPNPYVDFIIGLIKNPTLRPDIIAFDEVQNLKAPGSNRTLWLETVLEAAKGYDIKRLLLSAYPVPNRLEDAGVPLHLLDERYSLAKYYYRENPRAIRDMKRCGKWLTFTRDQLKVLLDLPELTEDQVPIEMDEEHVKQYLELWKNGSTSLGRKLLGLRRLSIDATYSGLRNNIGDIFYNDRNAQVLIFSELKTGIFDKLYEILQPLAPKGVQVVDGDMPFQQRVETAKKFRDGKVSIQINSEVMGEGIPLNTENVSYEIPLEPTTVSGVHGQRIGRLYRRGQLAPVHVREPIIYSEQLAELMRSSIPELEAQYHVSFPATWTATTIPADKRNIRLRRETVYKDKVSKALTITEAEESLMNTDAENISNPEHAVHLTSMPPISPESIIRNVMIGFSRQASLYGVGSKEVREAVEGKSQYTEAQKALVSAYAHPYAFLPQARIANFVGRLVNHLEESAGKFMQPLDIGCGSGTIGYELKRPLINFDIDPRMLDMARHTLHDIDGMEYVQGDITCLPFSDAAFDLIIASNALMYLAQRPENGNFRREIEKAAVEINRVLQDGKPLIVTLPHAQTTDEMFDEFNKILEMYGFGIKYADFYRLYQIDAEGKKRPLQKTFLTVAEKRYEADGLKTSESYPTIYKPSDYRVVGGTGRYSIGPRVPRTNGNDAELVIVGKRGGVTIF